MAKARRPRPKAYRRGVQLQGDSFVARVCSVQLRRALLPSALTRGWQPFRPAASKRRLQPWHVCEGGDEGVPLQQPCEEAVLRAEPAGECGVQVGRDVCHVNTPILMGRRRR